MPDRNNSTLKELLEQSKSLSEETEMFKELTYNALEFDGFNVSALEEFAKEIKPYKIEYKDEETLLEILHTLGEFSDDKIKELCKMQYDKTHEGIIDPNDHESDDSKKYDEDFENEYNKSKKDFLKGIIVDALNDMNDVLESIRTTEEVRKDINKEVDNYIEKLTSEEFMKKREDNIKKLKEKLPSIKDSYEKKKMAKRIEDMENNLNLSFITNILVGSPKEVEYIKDRFFDKTKSTYIMKKYSDNMKRLKYNPDLHLVLFNLEEKFLEEKYHVFNNLFLFNIVLKVAYVDRYNESNMANIRTLITYTANLFNHKFTSERVRENYLNEIRKFLDYFEPYRDKFEKDNILHPTHPERLEKERRYEEEQRKMMEENLKGMKYDLSDEEKALKFDEFRKMYDNVVNERVDEARAKADPKVRDMIDKLNPSVKEETSEKKEESE